MYLLSTLAAGDLISGLGFIVTALGVWVGCRALNTWKKQIPAMRRLEFLDQLSEATAEYIDKINDPIHYYKALRVRIWSHTDQGEGGQL